MRLINKWRTRHPKSVPISHYAPDLHVSSGSYVFPVSSEQRIASAEKRIDDMVAHTDMDNYNSSFFDQYIGTEEDSLIAQLKEQLQYHLGTNSAIALNHQSELVRLLEAIEQVQAEIKKLDREIDACQELYNRHN